jgi:hypothetical protein
VLLDQVEKDLNPLGRSEVRVILLLRTISVCEAREYLGDAFHLRRVAQAHCCAQTWFVRVKRTSLGAGFGACMGRCGPLCPLGIAVSNNGCCSRLLVLDARENGPRRNRGIADTWSN